MTRDDPIAGAIRFALVFAAACGVVLSVALWLAACRFDYFLGAELPVRLFVESR